MKKGLVYTLAAGFALACLFNSCQKKVEFATRQGGSTLGNPITASTAKVVGAVCSVIRRCFSDVTASSCETGVLSTDGLDASLGLPAGGYSTAADIVTAESNGQLFGGSLPTNSCTASLQSLSCADPAVHAAYDPAATNPFADFAAMVSATGNGSCGSIFQQVTYYLSPSGSDSNSGVSEGSPWLSFAKVFNPDRIVKAGDTIVLLDGTYTKSTTGLPEINCLTNANSGSVTSPVTLKAKNERQAFIQGDGSSDSFRIDHCAHWNILGLRAQSADLPTSQGGKDGSIFVVNEGLNIVMSRLVGAYNNRYFNTHTFVIMNSQNVLVEESEAYGFFRAGFTAFRSKNVIFRRSYANGRGRGQLPGACTLQGGDVSRCNALNSTTMSEAGFRLSGTANSFVENSLTEHATGGFDGHSDTTFDGEPGGWNNQFLGSISLNDYKSADFSAQAGPTFNNLYKDFVSYGTMNAPSIRPQSPTELRFENATILGNTASNGVFATGSSSCSNFPGGCSIRLMNTLVANNNGTGMQRVNQIAWTIEFSNSFNNPSGNYIVNSSALAESISDGSGDVQNSLSVAPTGMGLGAGQCLVWVPASSNMKGAGKNGADIGANVLYRYESGTLTSQPLWDRTTGAFPRGAIVPGLNDVPGDSLFDVHARLNVNRNGCAFPAGY
jgi:hypothetical protein